ncbi:MAG: hypothetical protein MUQ10_19745 [Anaerolineae bacterium]|nr:hypothetical protein [Anaerolineae bacterium]
MESGLSPLRGDPLPWLLEAESPSVRYWTLTHILDRPADDPDVLETRRAISGQPFVQDIFSRQHADGHWGDDQTKPHTAAGTLGVLSTLHTLGVSPDAHTAAGCDSFLRFCQNEGGGFSLTRTRRSAIFPCTTGEHLPLLVYFGLGKDPRVVLAFRFLVMSMSAEDALDCGRYQHRDCLWGAIAALKGLIALPEKLRSPESERVVRRLASALLEADHDFQGEHRRWLTFGVPRAWDLLSALRVLASHGCGRDPHFRPLLKLVLDRQDDLGRWPCGSVSRTWPLEKRNRPSKWVTLDALRVLKIAGVALAQPLVVEESISGPRADGCCDPFDASMGTVSTIHLRMANSCGSGIHSVAASASRSANVSCASGCAPCFVLDLDL